MISKGSMKDITILHYTAPPVIGGVENVILAHTQLFLNNEIRPRIITGRGDAFSFPSGVELITIPQMDTQHSDVLLANTYLEKGRVPAVFDRLVLNLVDQLKPLLSGADHTIVHNIFSKHFNLALTSALFQLLETGAIRNCISWVHDITWTSPSSGNKVFAGYPWDLIRTPHPAVKSVVVSKARQIELAGLYQIPKEDIQVIYNGVDLQTTLGISLDSLDLFSKHGILEHDLLLVMPIRITQAKNIEAAMRLVAELKRFYSHPKLVITGPPDPHNPANMDYYQDLLKLREELALSENVKFIYESGGDHAPLTIDLDTVSDLIRLSDCVLMLSHREGFGMPILEAGLCGVPVMATPVPASQEIAQQDIRIVDFDAAPADMAQSLLEYLDSNSTTRMKMKVKQAYTWQAIYDDQIAPLLSIKEKRHVGRTE